MKKLTYLLLLISIQFYAPRTGPEMGADACDGGFHFRRRTKHKQRTWPAQSPSSMIIAEYWTLRGPRACCTWPAPRSSSILMAEYRTQ